MTMHSVSLRLGKEEYFQTEMNLLTGVQADGSDSNSLLTPLSKT